MSLQIGIVGLPNVGKSTLFNALLRVAQAESANFPFTTIEPNVGIVAVPDDRLSKLTEMVHPEKVTPATVKFVDIAGLVRGAHKGEGLGNQFLAHIREVDAIAMVVRLFEDDNVIHVAGKVDPIDDITTIELELILADLATVTKRKSSLEGRAKTGDKTAMTQAAFYDRLIFVLESEKLLNTIGELTEAEQVWLKELTLLTAKPFLYVANVSESQLTSAPTELAGRPVLPISIKIEAELAELSVEDQAVYLTELGLAEAGRNQLIRRAYEILGLITYFTAGPKEVRAWTIRRGIKAPEAAGEIHTDFTRGFIAAEVIPYDKIVEAGSWNDAKTKGWLKTEGKDYTVIDGDVMVFRFNV